MYGHFVFSDSDIADFHGEKPLLRVS